MKRFLTFIVFMFPMLLCAQLRERIVASDGTQVFSNRYDTLTSAPKMWGGYVGQDIIFLPLDLEYSDKYLDYDCFFSDKKCTETYVGDTLTPARYIENKKFRVFGYDIIYRYEDEVGAGLILEMISDNSKLVFWKIPYYSKARSVSNIFSNAAIGDRVTLNLPIVINSFIERAEGYVGKKFVAKDSLENDRFSDKAQMIDLNSGDDIIIEKHKTYECIDLSLMSCGEYFKQPFLIFKDEKKREFRVSFMLIAGTSVEPDYRLSTYDFYNEKEWAEIESERIRKERAFVEIKRVRNDELIERFGEKTGKLIVDGIIKVGMTREMCELAIGKPELVSKVHIEGIVYEIWEYNLDSLSRKSLYFENDKLRMIQD